ncbi:MAG: GTP cyclohydrolase I FolE [Planctomycetota bacterium]|jgi:GTP cyclohydrolase I|nr:GTP cyclohydrolase I FolE [Planctomycetota bacterium]MDP7248506.1 GTP cyclohydrolase I FolE [Planctomycetota bacterium]
MSTRTGDLSPLIADLLSGIGEDPSREGLVDTPERVDKSLKYLTKGYAEDPVEVLNDALFTEDYNEMVVVKNIKIFSLCEHHMLPFVGVAHVAYLPDGKIVGLSKIARLVDIFARRLQVQERMTMQIAETINKVLQPRGVGVIIKAEHMCMQMRGVEKQDSSAITSAMLGHFRSHQETRAEFMKLIET